MQRQRPWALWDTLITTKSSIILQAPHLDRNKSVRLTKRRRSLSCQNKSCTWHPSLKQGQMATHSLPRKCFIKWQSITQPHCWFNYDALLIYFPLGCVGIIYLDSQIKQCLKCVYSVGHWIGSHYFFFFQAHQLPFIQCDKTQLKTSTACLCFHSGTLFTASVHISRVLRSTTCHSLVNVYSGEQYNIANMEKENHVFPWLLDIERLIIAFRKEMSNLSSPPTDNLQF